MKIRKARFTPFRALSQAAFKGFIRDKAVLFWTLMFPLMFLVIFGLLFGEGEDSKTKIAAVGEGPIIEALGDTGAVELVDIESEAKAKTQVEAGDLPAYVAENGKDITLRFAASDQTRAGTIRGIVEGVVGQANLEGHPLRYRVNAQQVEDDSLKPIQFLTPGLLSWAVAMAAVFGSAMMLVVWRKNQVLRRLRLSPVSPTTVLSSRLSVTLATVLVQGAVFLLVARIPVFGLQLSEGWWLAAPLLLLGGLAFFTVGMLVGAFSKSEEAATGAGNMIVLPMAFLSGAFFPIDDAPDWLRQISVLLPMRHLNDGLSAVLVRDQGIEALVIPMAVLAGFALVIGGIAARVFSWEDN